MSRRPLPTVDTSFLSPATRKALDKHAAHLAGRGSRTAARIIEPTITTTTSTGNTTMPKNAPTLRDIADRCNAIRADGHKAPTVAAKYAVTYDAQLRDDVAACWSQQTPEVKHIRYRNDSKFFIDSVTTQLKTGTLTV